MAVVRTVPLQELTLLEALAQSILDQTVNGGEKSPKIAGPPLVKSWGTAKSTGDRPIYTGIQSTVPITPSMGSGKATSGKPPDIEGILRQLISRVENSDPAFQSAIPDAGMGQPGNLSVSRMESHGVSRCPRIYIDFPLLLYGLVGRTPRWPVPGCLASTEPPG